MDIMTLYCFIPFLLLFQLNRDMVPKHSKLEFITNIDNPLPELGKTLIDGGDRYSYEFQAIYDNGNGTKSTARYTGYELITGGMRYGYQQVTTYGPQNNFAFRTLDEDRWSNWKVGVTKSDLANTIASLNFTNGASVISGKINATNYKTVIAIQRYDGTVKNVTLTTQLTTLGCAIYARNANDGSDYNGKLDINIIAVQ